MSFNLPFGIRVADDSAIDADRYIAQTIVQRDTLITNGRAKEGQQVYVEDNNTLYILKGTTNSDWEEIGGGFVGPIAIVDEGSGLGYVLENRDSNNFGPVGLGAFDLSISNSASNIFGATGTYSFALGENLIASGYSSVNYGFENTTSGTYSASYGYQNIVSGYASVGYGIGNTVSGNYNLVSGSDNLSANFYANTFGIGLINRSTGTTVVGQANADYASTGANINVATAPVFIVGNGNILQGNPNTADNANRSTALRVNKNGEVKFPSLTNTLIDNATDDIALTKGWFNANSVNNLTWQHATNTSGASNDVTENLIVGQATSFTSVVVHNAAIMSPEMVTNTMKNKGFAGLDIGGNGASGSVYAVRIKGINPNNGNVEIGDSTNDINTWNPTSEGRKNTVAFKRSFKPSAGATLTSAGDFQFTGAYANNPVNFDTYSEEPDSYYAAFESDPIITGTYLAANPQQIFALRGKGRMLLSDYGSGNVTEEVATHGLGVSANGRVVETALRVVGGLYLTTSIETVITTINTPVKVLGTTTGLTLNERLTATNNRLTYVGLQPTILKVTGIYAVDAGNNVELSFYIAKNGSILAETKSSVRVGAGGNERQGTIIGLIDVVDTDYIEIWVENNAGTGNLTCLTLNLNAIG